MASQNGRIALFGCHADCKDWSLVLNNGELGVNRGINGCAEIVGSGITASPGVWYHVVGTCDGTNAFIYVNGELKNSGPVDRNYVGSSSGLRMGGSICCGEYFVGSVDEATLYNRPLTDTEIFALYDAGRSGKTRSAVAPVITITPGPAGAVTLSWPAAASGFALYFVDELGQTWQPVTPPPPLVGDQYVLEVSTSRVSRFFRLQR